MSKEFAREYQKPVEQILGPETMMAVEGFSNAAASIISKKTRAKTIVDARSLSEARVMLPEDCENLREILLAPHSYWNGWPKYRRLPPTPDFAIAILHESRELSLMIDLQNPGWTFALTNEFYWGFNFANDALITLAKTLFPEYASSNKSSVWKKGAIANLEQKADHAG